MYEEIVKSIRLYKRDRGAIKKFIGAMEKGDTIIGVLIWRLIVGVFG